MKGQAQIEAEGVIAGLAVRLIAARAKAAQARRDVSEAIEALLDATAERRGMPEAHGRISILVLDGKFLVRIEPDPKGAQVQVHPIDVVG